MKNVGDDSIVKKGFNRIDELLRGTDQGFLIFWGGKEGNKLFGVRAEVEEKNPEHKNLAIKSHIRDIKEFFNIKE